MKTKNFEILIKTITGREFIVDTKDTEIKVNSEYLIYRTLPVSKRNISFNFKTPKNEENLLKSFINQYCKKYREPNPANYTGHYCGTYNPNDAWENKSEEEKEFCYYHHASNMFSHKTLLEQIKTNLDNPNVENTFCKYGFYPTIYGIGIFVLFSGKYEMSAIEKLSNYLLKEGIPFKNEFSNAKWVYRFIINLQKDIHEKILNSFNNIK